MTGMLTSQHAVSRLLHRYGALAAFDFAAAGSYVPINCRGVRGEGSGGKKESGGDDSLDVVMLSPHKLPGGPGSCGVLVMRRSMIQATVPQIPGMM